MTVLTIAMMLALQDVRQVHEDPAPRTGPVLRRVASAPSPVHQPRRPRRGTTVQTARKQQAATNPAPAPIPPPMMTVPPAPPAAAPLPRPGPLPVGAVAPVPRGDPTSWIVNSDYPMPMMRAHATGITAFDLDVDTLGRVYDCRITTSSGWPMLDATTCSLMLRRARLTPARNAAGAPIIATWSHRVRWDLPDVPVAYGAWARLVRYVVDKDGGVRSCTITTHGAVPRRTSDPCVTDVWRMKALHGPGVGLVTITYAEIHRGDDMALPAGMTLPQGQSLFERTIFFTVQPLGGITDCSVKADWGQMLLTSDYAVYDCHTGLRYLVPAAMQGDVSRGAAFTIQLFRSDAVPAAPPLSVVSPPLSISSSVLPPRAPPAPPLPPVMPARLATPRGSPQGWITNDDYPPAALRGGMQGTVKFRVMVDATGTPLTCVIEESSGYDLLDQTTCSLLMRRARFDPPLGADGRPAAGSWASRMRWEVPSDGTEPRPIEVGTWTRSLRFTIAENGAISNCVEELGLTRVDSNQSRCGLLSLMNPDEVRRWRGNSRGPVTLFVRQSQIEIGTPGETANPVPKGLKVALSQRASFEIGESGVPVACSGTLDRLRFMLPPVGCEPRLRYPASSAYKSVIVTQMVMTSGDTNIAAAVKFPEGD